MIVCFRLVVTSTCVHKPVPTDVDLGCIDSAIVSWPPADTSGHVEFPAEHFGLESSRAL